MHCLDLVEAFQKCKRGLGYFSRTDDLILVGFSGLVKVDLDFQFSSTIELP